MFKKFAAIAIAAVFTLFPLSGCKCDHRYLGTTTLAPGCETFGVKHYKCDFCGKSYDKLLPPEWHVNGGGDECGICGKTIAGKLKFDTDDESGTATVTKNTGDFYYAAKSFVIPAYYKEYAVTAVEEDAFSNLSFKSISLPMTTTVIKDRAFKNVLGMLSATIYGVETIGEEAFCGDGTLTSVRIYNLKHIGKNAFKGCSSLSKIYIYSGEEEFNSITVESGNDEFLSAEKIFVDVIKSVNQK